LRIANHNRKYISTLFVVVITSVGIGGCTAASYVSAMNKSTDQFLSSTTDPRVKYEPGAEAQAQIIAQALPAAIHTVEQAQYRRFVAPVNVYVCASIESFKAYTVNGGAGGLVLNKRLFISPKPENTAERLPSLLTHELSHPCLVHGRPSCLCGEWRRRGDSERGPGAGRNSARQIFSP
jgi:hypothetical protein